MKNLFFRLVFALFLLSFVPGLAQASQQVEVDFVYIKKSENGGAIFETVSAINENQVLPYATVVVNFDHSLSAQEKNEFETWFRIKNETNFDLVRHLHEVTLQISISGVNSSFYWRDMDTKLYYTPEGLSANKRFSILMPDGWTITNGWEAFTTLGFSGQNKSVYQVIIPSVSDWEQQTTTQRVYGSVSYVDCYFRDVDNRKEYTDTKIHMRGYTAKWGEKKSYTVEFDNDHLFTGFKDIYEYQGARKRIVLNGVGGDTDEDNKLINHKLSYDLVRKLEKRIIGFELTPDAYFGYITFNGRYWGLYLMTEHPDTGQGGWSTMKARRDRGFKEKGFLHKSKSEGKDYALFEYAMSPETEYDYLIGQGNGVERHWQAYLPYRPYVQLPWVYDPVDFNLEVEADDILGEQMELIPDTKNVLAPYDYFNMIDKKMGLAAGDIELFDADAQMDITFSAPVGLGEDIIAEYPTTYDYDLFYTKVTENNDLMFDWLYLDTVLIQIFFCRLTHAGDNFYNNFYDYMPEDNFETFMLGDVPKSSFYRFLWDCDKTLEPDHVLERLRPWPEFFPLAWQLAEESLDARFRYIELFNSEKKSGGVLTVEYYQDQMDQYLTQIGNGQILEDIRWARPLVIDEQLSFMEQQLSDSLFAQDYLLSLKPDHYIPPLIYWKESPHRKKFHSIVAPF